MSSVLSVSKDNDGQPLELLERSGIVEAQICNIGMLCSNVHQIMGFIISVLSNNCVATLLL